VIVGAGISGLACASTLFDAGEDFIIISRDVGGRVLQSADEAVPFGAFYVRADYEHVNRFVNLGRRIRSRDTLRHDHSGAYTRWDRRLLAHPVQVWRFLVLLQRFRRHLRRFRANSLTMSQSEAIAADPFLHALYHQPAPETVRQHRFGDIARHYVSPGLHGTAFLPLDRLTGFTMLLGSLPAVEPIYEFTLRWDDLLAGFADRVVAGSVRSIDAVDDGYRVHTEDGDCRCADNVVVATDAAEAQRLVGLDRINEPVIVHMFEISGRLRQGWAKAQLHLFSEDQPTFAILQRPGTPILLCSRDPDPRLDDYFSNSSILEHHAWEPAFNLIGDTLIECRQAPGLYVIGDHNVCGLEDAFLTGVFAAKQIISTEETSASTPSQRRPRTLEVGTCEFTRPKEDT
jgi:glycine/D-amino acid oxidase-like deaminating enzyme